MLNIIFKIMVVLPIFQTWLVWNGFAMAQYFEHVLYLLFSGFMICYLLIKNPKLNNNVLLIFCITLMFLCSGAFISLIQEMVHGYTSMKGIVYEIYKLTRNVSIFLFAYLFQTKNSFLKNIKLYITVTFIMVVVALSQYFFGIRAYQFLRFVPDPATYPDFYLVYLRDNRTLGLMKHPTIYSEFVIVSFMVLIFIISMKIKIYKNKKTQNFLLLLSLVGIFISSTRSAFLLSILIPIALSFLLKLKRIKRIYTMLLVLSAPFLVFAINQLLFKLWQYKYYTVQMGHTEYRLVNWKNAIDIVKDNKLFGSGLGTWGDASAKFGSFSYNGSINSMSDSFLSHLLAENGINLVFIATVFVYCLAYFYKNFKLHQDDFNKCMNVVGISLLLFTFLESFKSMQLSMFENTFFMFYLFGYIFQINNERTNVTILDEQKEETLKAG